MPTIAPKTEQAKQFLTALFGPYFEKGGRGYICIAGIEQPKPEGREPRIEQRFFESHEAAVAALPEVAAWHESGLDVYVTPNPLKKAERRADNVAAQVTVHCDLDGTTALPAMPLEPGIVVSSGHGLHAYWPLTEPERCDHPQIGAAVREHCTK